MKLLCASLALLVLALSFALGVSGSEKQAAPQSASPTALKSCPEFSQFPARQQDQLCTYKDNTNTAIQGAAYKLDRLALGGANVTYSYKGHHASIFVLDQFLTPTSIVFTENDGSPSNIATPNIYQISLGSGIGACIAYIDRTAQTVSLSCGVGALYSIYR